MKLHRYIYHVSNPNFRDAIAIEGLVPKPKSEQWLEDTPIEGKALFASNTENPYLYDNTWDDDRYRIDTNLIPDVIWQVDTNFGTDQDVYLYTTHSIPPNAIELIYQGTGESIW